MSGALILNASYEPLCIVSPRRALLLTLNNKAELLHASEGVFRSEKATFEVPSVVRLLHYVKVPFHAGMAVSKRAVFMRDGQRCQYCNGAAESIDHVIPKSRGGTHTWENVVAACRSCNSRKRDRLLEETSFVLKQLPARPRQRVWLLASVEKSNPDWVKYIKVPDVAQSLSA